jgi:hypothetical protein
MRVKPASFSQLLRGILLCINCFQEPTKAMVTSETVGLMALHLSVYSSATRPLSYFQWTQKIGIAVSKLYAAA